MSARTRSLQQGRQVGLRQVLLRQAGLQALDAGGQGLQSADGVGDRVRHVGAEFGVVTVAFKVLQQQGKLTHDVFDVVDDERIVP
ncbi:MAG: hypothetical protein U5L06_10645 [Rhodovibrio sp.]|nr:hypothetical protein [Rhodovibrio sp.]